MVDHAEDIIFELQDDYRRVPPSPSYTRTFTLQQSWLVPKVKLTGRGMQALVENVAVDPYGRDYSSKVQGPDQIALHARRKWRTVKAIRDKLRPAFRAEIRQIMRRARET
jgi:hypothetical protein